MQRVVVVGPPGSGKSTFAAALGLALGVVVFERDAHGQLGSDEYRSAVAALLKSDRWVFDGFPYYVDEDVYAASDTVVALRFNRSLVVKRVVTRSLALLRAPSGGHVRSGIWTWFNHDHAVRVAFTKYGHRIAEIDELPTRPELGNKQVLILRNPIEVARLLEDVTG